MSPLRGRWLLPLLLAAVVAAGGGAAEARAATPTSNDQTMKKLERIVRDRVDSKRSTGIVAGMVFPCKEQGTVRRECQDAVASARLAMERLWNAAPATDG